MNSKTVKKVKGTMDSASSKALNTEVEVIQSTDPVEKTKRDVLEFLSRRFKTIEEDRKLKKVVSERLYNMLNDENNELSLNQLMGVYKTLGEDEIASVDSLLQILRPVANTQNPWIERKTSEEFEKEKAFKDLDGKDLQAISSMSKFMEVLEGKLSKADEKE